MSDTASPQDNKTEETKAPVEAAEKPVSAAKTAVAEKPAAAAAEKPAAPAEPSFTVDALLNCTARYTHKAWYLFYNNQKDMTFIRQTPVRATLECRTTTGAEEIHRLLVDAGVKEISRQDKVISMTATFEQIQIVIKHPQSYMLDAVKL